jgi:arsenical pump membrane protein
VASVLIWIVTAGAIAGVLFRPKEWQEAVWACLGAALLVLLRLIPLSVAASAVAKGTDVYLFLAGMMLLADLARHEGVFAWMAGITARAAKGSRSRLFALIYLVGILVTAFLSNDATAVVLTPAVYAVLKKTRGEAQPYLFACAFVSNAASFVLPISNPANLVVYGKTLPPLVPWLRAFALPSLASIGVTFLALKWLFRKPLRGGVVNDGVAVALTGPGRRTAWGIAGTGAVLITASGIGLELGLPTCLAAMCAVVIATRARPARIREIAREISWSVLPLVAGLFVLVAGMERAGGSEAVGAALRYLAGLPPRAGSLGASFGIAALSNVVNNLPSGLLVGGALAAAHATPALRSAVLIGVDLGPNLSVTGSLATVLWLIALRREGENVSAWTFLKYGAVIMLPALLVSTLTLLV